MPPETNPPPTQPQAFNLRATGDDFPLTELGNADRLLHMFGKDIRYCHALGFLVWDGRRWQVDINDEAVSRRYAYVIRDVFVQAEDLKRDANASGDSTDPRHAVAAARKAWAIKSEANGKRAATLEWAKRLDGVCVSPGDLDTNPWLLNCRNGTLDLLTGILRDHDRDDLITRIAPVAYVPGAPCPVWLKCLETWLPGDAELDGDASAARSFMQRAFGYSLTGSTGAETAFFLFGSGRNGKSKFVAALEHILGYSGDGGYAARIPFAALSDEKRGGGTTPELVNLVGARFVIASEPAMHHRFNDALIKDLTGSDRITVNPKHRPQFEFKPQFKLWIYGNHKPRMNSVDDGMKSRLPLVPFTVTIAADQRDADLENKLQAEAEGILAWAVAGCLEWRKHGLTPPPSVVAATEDYHTENDPFAGFFEECTVVNEAAFATMGDIMAAFKTFAAVNDDTKIPHLNTFAERLRGKGAKTATKRIAGKVVRGWFGIGVLADTQDAEGESATRKHTPGDPSVTPVTPVTPTEQYPSHVRARGADFIHPTVSPVTSVTNEETEKAGKEEKPAMPPSVFTTPAVPGSPPLSPARFDLPPDEPFAILSTLPRIEDYERAKQAATATALPPVVWTRARLNKHADEQWHLVCVDDEAPVGERGAGEGWGDTKAQALDDTLQDPFQTDRQRAALEAERGRIEAQEGGTG